ncbi:MAG: 30S ribosome-binding factor RbfA [Pseudomonadota bacterium]
MSSRDFTRSSRLGGQIHRVLNELLRFETKDPRLDGVTVSGVDLSRDLSVARVFVATLTPDADPAPVMAALEKAAGFLRGRLGREIKVRHVPELRFAHDDSVARGFHLSALIDGAGASTDEDASDESE